MDGIFTEARESRNKTLARILRANLIIVKHTLAAIPNSIKSIVVDLLDRYQVKASPKQSRTGTVRFFLGPVSRLRAINPSMLYEGSRLYRPSNLVRTEWNTLWSKPVTVMCAYSKPDISSAVHAEMDSACSDMRGTRRLHLCRRSAASLCRKVKRFR